MRLLLDTHVVLWALSDPNRLSRAAATAIADPGNDAFVSAVSAWEIGLKQSIGKLELPGPAEVWLPAALARTGLGWLPLSPVDALRGASLPWHHRDPFDRMLVAQAMGGLVLVTHDRCIEPYPVTVLWTS